MRPRTRRFLSYLLLSMMLLTAALPVSMAGAFAEPELSPPAEEQAVNEQPAEEQPAEEQPAEEQPAEEQPAEEQPAEEQPAEEQPADEQPAEEQPAEEQPAEEQPAEEQPAEEQPAEEQSAFSQLSLPLVIESLPNIICEPAGTRTNPSGHQDPDFHGFFEYKFDNINSGDNNDTLTENGITVTFHDGIKWIDWSSTFPIAYVFVKGGNDGYLYTYSQWLSEDCGLRPPTNNGGQWPDISHVTFYYKPDLQLEKSVDPEMAMVGDTVTYSFKVTNNSSVQLKDVQVFDNDIPYTSGKVTLNAGASHTFTKTYVLQASDFEDGKFINEAKAKGYYKYSQWWKEVSDEDDALVTLIVPEPGISIEKSVDPEVSKVGNTVTYTFTVTNTGNIPLHGVTVSDPMFSEGWPRVYEGALAAGGIWQFTQEYMIPSDAQTPMVNTASVSTDEEVGDEDDATVILKGKLTVIKTIGSENGLPHAGVTFTLTPDEGEAIEGITDESGMVVFEDLEVGMSYHLEEDVPEGYLTSLSEENSFEVDEDGAVIRVVNTPVSTLTVIKHIGSLEGPAHEGVTFNLKRVYPDLLETAVVDPVLSEVTDSSGQAVFTDLVVGGWYELDEIVPEGYSTDLNEENNLFQIDSDGVVVHVINTLIPDNLTVIKTIGSEDGPVHSGVTFELYPIYPESEIVVQEGPMTEITDENGIAVFEDLSVGMSYRLVEVVPDGYMTNLDPENSYYIDGEEGVVVRVVNTLSQPAIDIEKSVNSTLVRTGTTVTYTFVVTNTGNTELYSVEINDDTIGWSTTIESMEAGESQVFTVDYTIDSWNSGSQFINTVTVTAYDPQENTVSDEDSATVNRRRTGGGGGGGGGTTTTVIEPDPVPEAVPEVTPAPVTAPEPETMILEEIVPLAVPVLPKTGELPANLFYGLGGLITAVGAFLKRK